MLCVLCRAPLQLGPLTKQIQAAMAPPTPAAKQGGVTFQLPPDSDPDAGVPLAASFQGAPLHSLPVQVVCMPVP